MLWPRRIWWARAEVAAIEWPAECATCGARLQREAMQREAMQREAMQREAMQREAIRLDHRASHLASEASDAAHPAYCSTCRETHAKQAASARVLAAIAVLAAVAMALVFPLLEPSVPIAGHLLVVTALALVPIAGLGSARQVAAWGSAPRVYGLGPLGTCVERRALIGHLPSGHWRPMWLPPLVYRTGWSVIPAIGVALAVLAHGWHHPRLWVINLTRERLWLAVDGALAAALDPAGNDAARAALELRLPRGERTLEVFDERHQRVASVRAILEGGHDHLYAPTSAGFCFWLESTGYGRDGRPQCPPARFGLWLFFAQHRHRHLV